MSKAEQQQRIAALRKTYFGGPATAQSSAAEVSHSHSEKTQQIARSDGMSPAPAGHAGPTAGDAAGLSSTAPQTVDAEAAVGDAEDEAAQLYLWSQTLTLESLSNFP